MVSGKSRMKKPRRVVVGIYLDDAVADAYEQANAMFEANRLEQERTRPRRIAEYAAAGNDPETALGLAHGEDGDVLAPHAQARDAALAALDAATEWFVFEAVGHRRLRRLIELHPPTAEQQAAAAGRGQELAWNPATFPRALVEDSCVAPAGVDWDEVFGATDDDEAADGTLPAKTAWSDADVEALVAHALNANQSLRLADKARRPAGIG